MMISYTYIIGTHILLVYLKNSKNREYNMGMMNCFYIKSFVCFVPSKQVERNTHLVVFNYNTKSYTIFYEIFDDSTQHKILFLAFKSYFHFY